MASTNKNGLSLAQWLDLAGKPAIGAGEIRSILRSAWHAGEDPRDWRNCL